MAPAGLQGRPAKMLTSAKNNINQYMLFFPINI